MQTLDRRYFPLLAGQRVLDLGCGEGRHVIAAFLDTGADAVGVDLSLGDLATARARLAEQMPDGKGDQLFALLNGSALQLPFPDKCFDAVICSEVLEHVAEYRQALLEIRRVLKANGMLCVSVPRRWPERLCWLLSREYHLVPGGHLRIFDARRLQALIEGLGFHTFHRHGAHALHVPYWWLQCLFWKSREHNLLVRQYHRLLVWDMMKAPALTRFIERLLNPVMGKSVVMYFRKAVDA